jgi:murein DD-endopeptidase MepM/ murein hydrolase activator NlpD
MMSIRRLLPVLFTILYYLLHRRVERRENQFMQADACDDSDSMSSLISDQQVNSRRASEELHSQGRRLEVISHNIPVKSDDGFRNRLSRAIAENQRRVSDDKPGRKQSGWQKSRRAHPRSGSISRFKLIRASESVQGGNAALARGEVLVSSADLLFMGNALIVFMIFAGLFITAGGIQRLLPSYRMSLPADVYAGAFLASEAPREVSEPIAPIDIDTSQFQALEVVEYVIQPGDTLSQLALDYDLNMDTIVSFNQIPDAYRMMPGDVYQLPNRDGLLHQVASGDTLLGLAEEYGSSLNAILDANSLASSDILPGQAIFIPGARMNDTDLRLALGELFIYPTVGRFTSGFGNRIDPFTGTIRFHNGVDWANSIGTPVRAAMAGTVVRVENQIGNYGKFVIIEHPKGFQTLYAHLNTINVRRGQYVSQNELIGRMGNTGRSTGSHLHFTIFKNMVPVDPLAYLH